MISNNLISISQISVVVAWLFGSAYVFSQTDVKRGLVFMVLGFFSLGGLAILEHELRLDFERRSRFRP